MTATKTSVFPTVAGTQGVFTCYLGISFPSSSCFQIYKQTNLTGMGCQGVDMKHRHFLVSGYTDSNSYPHETPSVVSSMLSWSSSTSWLLLSTAFTSVWPHHVGKPLPVSGTWIIFYLWDLRLWDLKSYHFKCFLKVLIWYLNPEPTPKT